MVLAGAADEYVITPVAIDVVITIAALNCVIARIAKD